MKTRRIRLKIEGANVSFWLLVFQDEDRLHRYVERMTGISVPERMGPGPMACLADPEDREIRICLAATCVGHHIIGHEAFHAAMYYARMNRRRWTRRKWEAMLTQERWDEPLEEDMADVCGSVISAIWEELENRFAFDNPVSRRSKRKVVGK